MTKSEKLLEKLKNSQKTFVFSELVTLLKQLGFTMHEREGSRVVFICDDDSSIRIHLHKPHPENTIKGGALKAVKHYLEEKGYFSIDTMEQHDDDL
ncbi:type II toxin-antitoxin system HicA family toxin [Moraxella sp. ZY210820]|uniref:type II toxin-antitoxin system HicA family toxin n=1 Tax=unclassified Moraxella TaxID=2685852 RepID=UPI002731EF1B|nr:type II toxin-antitoxin system HicA family toxin [Moraxella sp. ZY210820]WLF83548.1 type II toxin-antitoxin system HicA family toxin [Moraxella sp. ZY210820]